MNERPFFYIIKKSAWIIHDYLGTLIFLNVLWCLSALLIIPLPPVTFAIFYITGKMADYKDINRRDFQAGFLRFFWRSWILFSIIFFLHLALLSNYLFYKQFEGFLSIIGALCTGLCFWFTVVLVIQQVYLPTILIHDNTSVFKAYKKSGLLFVDNIKLTLQIALMLLSMISLLILSGIGLVMIGFSSMAVICSVSIREILRRYQPENYSLPSAEEETRSFKHVLRPWVE